MFLLRSQVPMRLPDLLKAASASARKDILHACIKNPRTDSLRGDTPAVTIAQVRLRVPLNGSPVLYAALTHSFGSSLLQDALDLNAIVEAIQRNAELIALSALPDVELTLKVLIEVQDSAYLGQFDTIQIYRGGINLLQIVNRSRHVNRSACVDIDVYKRRLHEVSASAGASVTN